MFNSPEYEKLYILCKLNLRGHCLVSSYFQNFIQHSLSEGAGSVCCQCCKFCPILSLSLWCIVVECSGWVSLSDFLLRIPTFVISFQTKQIFPVFNILVILYFSGQQDRKKSVTSPRAGLYQVSLMNGHLWGSSSVEYLHCPLSYGHTVGVMGEVVGSYGAPCWSSPVSRCKWCQKKGR